MTFNDGAGPGPVQLFKGIHPVIKPVLFGVS